MQDFDPKVAYRVWQRVQAANEEKCTERPACPLDGIPTVPAVQREPAKKQVPKRCCKQQNDCLPVLLLLLLRFAG